MGYTASGYRVRLLDGTNAGNSRRYVYTSGGRLLCEYLASGTPSVKRQVIYLGADPIAEADSNGIHELHKDHLGSPRVITNNVTGKIEGLVAYGAYGEYLGSSSQGYLPLIGYTGHIQADSTGLIYMRGRFYSPVWHCFLNSNQGADPTLLNQNSYCGGSPMMGSDPSGLDRMRVSGVVVRPFLHKPSGLFPGGHGRYRRLNDSDAQVANESRHWCLRNEMMALPIFNEFNQPNADQLGSDDGAGADDDRQEAVSTVSMNTDFLSLPDSKNTDFLSSLDPEDLDSLSSSDSDESQTDNSSQVVGTLTISANGNDNGSCWSGGMSGHAWLTYAQIGESPDTYGTWGNNPRGLGNGLQIDLELGMEGEATRSRNITGAQFNIFIGELLSTALQGNGGWGYFYPCSSFAAHTWNLVTGESLNPYGPYSNPSTLKNSIIKANGGSLHFP
jgi:RHS repeat-associated protein